MNPKQTVPLLATLPLLAVAPPLLIGAAIGLGLLWLLSDDDKEIALETHKPMSEEPNPTLVPMPAPMPKPMPKTTPVAPAPALSSQANAAAPIQFKQQTMTAKRRITREDLAEALEYGARSLPLSEAVIALQARGFGKTAAYKALSSQSKFRHLIESTPDGLVEWKG